jgi:hypothetical protein
MARPTLTVLATALVLALAAGTTQAAKAKKVETQVEIELARYTGNTALFLGDVHSRKSKCERAREVTLVHGTAGAVATTRTDGTGDWELTPSSSEAPEGFYTAEVARKKIKKGEKKIICKAATSNEVALAD